MKVILVISWTIGVTKGFVEQFLIQLLWNTNKQETEDILAKGVKSYKISINGTDKACGSSYTLFK